MTTTLPTIKTANEIWELLPTDSSQHTEIQKLAWHATRDAAAALARLSQVQNRVDAAREEHLVGTARLYDLAATAQRVAEVGAALAAAASEFQTKLQFAATLQRSAGWIETDDLARLDMPVDKHGDFTL